MSVLLQGNLLPFRVASEAETINLFALEGTGLNGTLVSLVTGSQDPNSSAGTYAGGIQVGASFANVTSLRHLVTRRVRPSQPGDSYNVLGVTLHTVAEYDENGRKLILEKRDDTLERGFVASGQAVPILARGILTIKSGQCVGNPIAGYPLFNSATVNGKMDVVAPTVANLLSLATGGGTYSGSQYIGKCLSSATVSGFGSYFQFKLEL
jgi:hypothetical protein